MNFILETVVLCAVVSFSAAQVTRPRINPQINLLSTFPGFPMSNGTRESKVVIDLYLDLVCPDSEAAFPVLQEVATAYQPEDLAVYIHQLPLPYHRNGFLLAQGYFQVVEKAPGMLQDYVTMCFNNISTFQGSTNKEKSEWEFTGILAKLQEGVTGIPSLQFVRDLPNYFGIAVSHWKYGVRKGVAGNPWFFVNDIDLGVNPNDEVDYNTWTILINILLRSHDMALPDQEINLDDYLHNNNDNSYNAQGISNIVEQKPLVARQISRYLREIMQRNYFPVHSKLAINNARNSPTHKSQP